MSLEMLHAVLHHGHQKHQNSGKSVDHDVRSDVNSVLKKIRTHLDLLSIPQLGGINVKTFRWDQRLQIQNLSMAFKRVPRWK